MPLRAIITPQCKQDNIAKNYFENAGGIEMPNKNQVETIGRLLTVDELAQRLSVPRSWIYKNVQRKAIPYIKVGRYLRFCEASIDQHLRENQTLAQ
jgi:excisionase family DNA binding protein